MNIRAHHLLCILRFKGGSYNKKIRDKFHTIQKRIREASNLKIKIIKFCDDICKSCPYQKGNLCMKKEVSNKKITEQDKKVIKKLNIKENQTLAAKEIIDLLIKKIKNTELKRICRGCEFLNDCLKKGLNKSFINSISQNFKT